jgi:hypothetical protein
MFARAILAAKLFNDINEPNITLRKCSKIYFNPPIHDLHTMLSELERAVREYTLTQSILPSKTINIAKSYSLDEWIYMNTSSKYKDLSLFECYMLASELVLKLFSFKISEHDFNYIERRCLKMLTTFCYLGEVMGVLKYKQ